MHSDTIVGIVGAVVLVSVMVGVFAYEYNNVPEAEDEAPDEAAMMAAFNETFPTLGATDDIDGDGLANYNDTDIDGDGIDNANDTDVQTPAMSIQGSASAGVNGQGASSGSHDVAAFTGVSHIHATISFNAGAGGSTTSGLNMQLAGPGGFTRSATCNYNGASSSCTIALDTAPEGLGAGDYTVTVRHNGVAGTVPASQAVAYTGSITLTY